MKQLLEKINIIDFKYGKFEDKNQFNIFTILRDGDDERYLHSKFIYELLNEVGANKDYKRFLEEFLKVIEIENFSSKGYSANIEYENIDLFLCNFKQAIIIENKIYAGDQKEQLQRYFNLINESDDYDEIFIFYLTLDGHKPSSQSLGNLKKDKVKLISYENHIRIWITKCIEIASTNPALRESLIQYLKLINNLTGNSMESKKEQEIIKLLSKNDNIMSAYTIFENWDSIKLQTELNFWKNLESALSINYTILDFQKYSETKIDKYIYAKKNRNPWYGIMFKISTFKDIDVCLFIEKGWGDIYYGITMLKENSRECTDNKDFSLLSEKIVAIDNSWVRETLWLGGSFFEHTIDFTAFSEENTLKLVKPEYQKIVVSKCIVEIDLFVKNVLKIIENLKID